MKEKGRIRTLKCVDISIFWDTVKLYILVIV